MKRVSLALLAAILCVAQTPLASLSGSVYDELGGPIIAAKLSLRSEKSPLYLTKTTEQGTFQFPRITDAGSYTLSIDQAGFCKVEIAAIVVAAGERKTLPRVTLKVPAAGQNCP
jgi:hypothetical protein